MFVTARTAAPTRNESSGKGHAGFLILKKGDAVTAFKMKEMIRTTLALAVLVPGVAMADEELIANNQKQKLVGMQAINVMDQLNLWRMRGMKVNSLIVVASTERGMGQLEVVAEGQAVAQRRVGTQLESIQVPLNLDGRREMRGLEIRTRGNFTIAMVGVTVEERGFGGPGDGRPGDGRPGGPGYPGGPGDNRPPMPPHQPPGYGGNQLSKAEFDALITEMNRSPFDQGKFDTLQQFQRYWGNKAVSMEQAGAILQLFIYDEKRLEAVKVLKPVLQFDIVRMDLLLRTFVFDRGRNEARQILMAR